MRSTAKAIALLFVVTLVLAAPMASASDTADSTTENSSASTTSTGAQTTSAFSEPPGSPCRPGCE